MKKDSEMERYMRSSKERPDKFWDGLDVGTANALICAGAESLEDIKDYVASGAPLTKLIHVGTVRAQEILKWLDDKPPNHRSK